MRASQIKIFYPELNIIGLSDVEVSGIEINSKKIKPGNIFVAIKGKRFDSHAKIDEAFRNGAIGVVLERDLEIPQGKLKILTDDGRKTYAMLSSLFFDFPSAKLKVIGITGTSGKTTTAFLLYKFFNSIGIKSGFIGTIGIGSAKTFHRTETFPPTTPDAFPLNEILSNMLKDAIKYIFMEVSAQAITFKRIVGIKFYRKILTTIGHEHLDLYETFEDYLNTKISFFNKEERVILNADSAYIEKFKEVSSGYTLYGIENPADVEGSIRQQDLENVSFTIKYKGVEDLITLNMSGIYNVSNFLAASTFILEEGYKIDDIRRFAIHTPVIPGRGNLLQKNGKSVFVDFAHNPLEIENVLKYLRRFTTGRLITVFGAVGFSTYKKRVEMGEIASKYSDFVVITTDDPRGDDPEKIAEDILTGVKNNGKIVLNRKEAIREGISMLKEGDTAAILGRGDETEMHYKDKKIYLKDLDTAKEVLDES
jgi:UDP-N-acetylmuramoyl-L-alanyl-D-glutamate--2,6-diaminopimelate ligase